MSGTLLKDPRVPQASPETPSFLWLITVFTVISQRFLNLSQIYPVHTLENISQFPSNLHLDLIIGLFHTVLYI